MVKEKGKSRSGKKGNGVNEPDAENAESVAQKTGIDKAMQGKKKTKAIKCPKCGSTQTRVRITTGELVCYGCGAITSIRGEVKGGIKT